MEIVLLKKDQRVATQRALRALDSGGVLLFPTDTVYGIGGDALRRNVVFRIRRLKKRPSGKPFPWLVSDLVMAKRYGRFSKEAERYARSVWPGAVTIVVRVPSGRGTRAFRVPKHRWLRKLIAAYGRPLIGTSANRSGDSPARTARRAGNMLSGADLLIDGGTCAGKVSRVLDCTGRATRVLRR